jgi:hypothetical protein
MQRGYLLDCRSLRSGVAFNPFHGKVTGGSFIRNPVSGLIWGREYLDRGWSATKISTWIRDGRLANKGADKTLST